MKAAVYRAYGPADVLKIADIPRPRIKDDEVLIKVYATSVTTADWRIRASAFPGYAWLLGRLMFGLFRPRKPVLGSDFAGRIVAKGDAVTRFKGGDEVFGFAMNGAHADFIAVAEDAAIAPKPAAVGYDQAAAIPFGALAALVFLRDFAGVRPGHKVLIHGASGGVGVYAVQLAKHLGATVTGVASTANLDLLRALGADRVFDYTKADFTQTGDTYDVILDTVGKTRFAQSRKALTPKGVYVPLEFGLREMFQALRTAITGGKRVKIGVSGDSLADLQYLTGLLDAGALIPVIDSRYPLDQIADAHRRVESRHKTGAVIVVPETGAPALTTAA